MASLESVEKFAHELSAKVIENEPMSKHTTFRIGGPADLFVVPKDNDTLEKICGFCKESQIPVFVLGNGSNLLVSDKGIRGVVIKSGSKSDVRVDGTNIFATAGTNLIAVCEAARKHNLTGLEWAYGIPGSVGGAVYMNAGAYKGEIRDVVVETRHLDGGVCGGFNARELDFGYRHSAYTGTNLVITDVKFSLSEGDPEKISARMEDLMTRRKTKQPLDMPSAGSVFKRPEGYFAGALIEGCGLKGTKVGGAMVSPKHAGFIVNAGGATCSDVLALVKKIQKEVFDKNGVELECEIKAVGEI